MSTLNDDQVLDPLVPHSIKNESQIAELTATIDPHLKTLYAHLDDGLFYPRIDELDSETLDHLAAQWQPLVWRDSWPLETKRKMLRTLIKVKSLLGTKSAVESVLDALDGAATIIEWWEHEPKHTAHTFEVIVDQTEIEGIVTADQIYDLQRLIHLTKPVRSQFTFTVMQKGQAFLNALGYGRPVVSARISNDMHERGEVTANMSLYDVATSFVGARLGLEYTIPHEASAEGRLEVQNAMTGVAHARITTPDPQNPVFSSRELIDGYVVGPVTQARIRDELTLPHEGTGEALVELYRASVGLSHARITEGNVSNPIGGLSELTAKQGTAPVAQARLRDDIHPPREAAGEGGVSLYQGAAGVAHARLTPGNVSNPVDAQSELTAKQGTAPVTQARLRDEDTLPHEAEGAGAMSVQQGGATVTQARVSMQNNSDPVDAQGNLTAKQGTASITQARLRDEDKLPTDAAGKGKMIFTSGSMPVIYLKK